MPAGAALYGTVLAAHKTVAASYQPGYVNAVIVLTARVETRPDDPVVTTGTGTVEVGKMLGGFVRPRPAR